MQVTQRNYPAGHGRLKTILARRLEKKEVCADYRSYESQPWTEMKMSMALLRSAYSYMQALMSLRKILKTIYSFWDR